LRISHHLTSRSGRAGALRGRHALAGGACFTARHDFDFIDDAILVSTFTAAMHPINPMAGHILPVIFNGHLGIKFNDVARYTTGGFDPDEFWHAWARGRDITIDIFDPGWQVWHWVEHDLEDLRRTFNVSPAGVPR
jgi:hypothetical protein